MHQVEMQGKSHRQAAENLCVCPSTVSRTVALFNDTGSVDKSIHHVSGVAHLLESTGALLYIYHPIALTSIQSNRGSLF